jgi:hypothetical protein
MLIFGLTIIQIGTAFTESVTKWFNKGIPRALDLGYKEGKKSFIDNRRDFTGPANESTGCISYIKPTDVYKHYMFNSTSLASNSQEAP